MAEDTARGARRAETDKAQATGGARAMSLRSVFKVEIADDLEALRTMITRHRDEMVAHALVLAQRDVREGRRSLPGFTVTEERVPV